MNMTNKDLISLLHRVPAHITSPESRCPPSKELVDSFAPSASIRSKTRIIEHISECPECRAAFEILMTITECDKRESHCQGIEKRFLSFLKSLQHNQSLQLLSARFSSLIIGCLMIGFSILVIVHRNDVSRQFRELTANIVLEYPTVSHNTTDNLIFRWNMDDPARFFILELFDDALLPIWTSGRIEALQIQIPEELRSILQPGKPYYWMITAYSEADDFKESNMVRFVVR